MTSEEINQIRNMLRTSPRSIWGYWLFIFPVLFTIGTAIVVTGLFIYWEKKMPDLEVLFRQGTRVAPIAGSQLVREAVMSVALLVAVTFVLLVYLARIAFRQVQLLRAAARELGIDDGQPGGQGRGDQPLHSETNRTSPGAGSGG